MISDLEPLQQCEGFLFYNETQETITDLLKKTSPLKTTIEFPFLKKTHIHLTKK